MKSILYLAAVIVVSSSGFLEIDDLQKMVSSDDDRAQLEVLDDDKYTPRSQIQQQVNEIVQRQSQDVQVKLRPLKAVAF